MGNFFPASPFARRSSADVRTGTRFAYTKRTRSGHTLVEIVLALAIVGVMAAIGVSASREQIARYHLMQSARMLHSDLLYLRAEAITSNREMRVLFVEADAAMDPDAEQVGAWTLQAGNRHQGSTAWDTLPIDQDGDVDDSRGARDLGPEGDDRAGGISLAPWPALEGPGSTGINADALVFSPRGFVANPPTDFTDGYVSFELVNKRALAAGGDERVRIHVSRGGLVRMETGPSSRLASGAVGTGEASTR